MTTTVQTTNLIGITTQRTLGTQDALFIVEGVIISTTGGSTTIRGTGGENSLYVDGTVISDGYTAQMSGGDNVVSVGREGVIRSNNETAADTNLFLAGGNNTLTNAGLIASERTIAVLTIGSDNEVINTGSIIGSTGVFLGLGGDTGDRVINSGTIIATDVNPLTSVRYNHGVFSEGNNTTIINEAGGLIQASYESGSGVSLGNGGANSGIGSVVVNHGTITSAQYWGVDFFNLGGDGSASLLNTGLIQGAEGSFRGDEGSDDVVNSGHMIGNVELGQGDDVFDGRGGDVTGQVLGGAGSDIYYIDDGSIDLVELAGQGNDQVFAGSTYTLGANIERLTLLGSEDIHGFGNMSNNTIIGNGGDNRLSGFIGNDTLNGLDGDDLIRGGLGNDTMNGGTGDDTISGGGGNDVANGLAGNDLLRGRLGDDTLNGGVEDDLLFGNGGSDILNGGLGNDTLVGGHGQDTLNGGTGSDTFVFRYIEDSRNGFADRINGYVQGVDQIDLSQISSMTDTAFFGGSLTGSGNAELRILNNGTDTRILFDSDGSGLADMRINVLGVVGLEAEDFIL